MSFLNSHKKNIISEKISRLDQLEPGHIVMFNYTGEDVNTRRPLVLVLNPSWKSKLHGIKLDAVPEAALQRLYSLVKEKRMDKIRKLLRLRLTLLSSSIINPERFYKKKIKSWMQRDFKTVGNPYRTYSRKGITSIRLIDYRFKDYDTGEEDKTKKND